MNNLERKNIADTFYEELQSRFSKLLKEHEIEEKEIQIAVKSMSPQEAIGVTKRKDYPILTGKDIMIQAECGGCFGQAFTDAPSNFSGTLAEIAEMDIFNDAHAKGLFIAALNAVMKYLGLVDCTVHCRNGAPEFCAQDAVAWIKENYGNPKIIQIGFQPALLEHLSKEFQVRVFDLNPDNVGTVRYGVPVEDGTEFTKKNLDNVDLILCTGSTICNGTIVNFLDLDKDVRFYGTTLAGAAYLMDLPRLCFADRYQKESKK